MLRLIIIFLLAVLATPHADDWGQMATISSTMGVQGGKLCLGEASRGDIGCPVYAPSLTAAGHVSVTGNLSAAKFLGDGSLLVNLPAGTSLPAGAIMAFDLASCPTGWSEYTPARGRFLRGIDNGAGNDPAGTRAAGNVQADGVGPHSHYVRVMQNGDYANFGDSGGLGGWGMAGAAVHNQGLYRIKAGDESGTSHALNVIAETRPKNVAVLYCRKN